MKEPTYGTNWERDLARCAAALERLVQLQESQPKRQPKREAKQ